MSKRQRTSVAKERNTQFKSLEHNLSLLNSEVPQPESETYSLSSEAICVLISHDEKRLLIGQMTGTISMFTINESVESTLIGHSAEVKCLALSSDSEYLISGSYDNTLMIWSLSSQTNLKTLSDHTSHVFSVVISSDDRYFFSSSNDRSINIWNLSEMRLESKLENMHVIGYCMNLSSDDTLLAIGCNDSLIKIWNIRENREEVTFVGHDMPIYALKITEDLNYVVSASIDRTIRKWNIKTGKQEKLLAEGNESIKSVAVTSDDKYVVYGRYDGRITIISAHGLFEEINIMAHNSVVNSVHISRSNKYLASASNDCSVRLLKISEFPSEVIREGHKREINNIEISKDSALIASASHDHSILIWSFSENTSIGSLIGHTAEVYCVAFTSDNRCISGGVDEKLKVWDLNTFTLIEDLKGHDESIRSIAVTSDDSKAISGSMDNTLRIWNLKTYEEIFVLKGHESMVNCVAVRNSKYAVSGSSDNTVRLWDIKKGLLSCVFTEHNAEISCLAITNNKKKLLCGARDGRISVWNLKFKHFEFFLHSGRANVNKLCLSGDSQFVFTQHENKLIKLWSLADKQILGDLYCHKKILSLAVSADNEWIVISTQNKMRVMRSPLSKKTTVSVVPYEYSFLFRAQVYRLLHGNYKTLIEDCLKCVFLPWNINILHVISHMNYPKLLKTAISTGAKFLGSENGETPLTVSLSRRSKLCAEILIKRIPKELYDHNTNIFEYLGEILNLLNRASLRSLHKLYDAAFPLVTNQALPKFGRFKKKAPIIILSDSPKINSKDFLKESLENQELMDIEIEFRQSLLKLDLSRGSSESIKFIKSLNKCKNDEVFRSELVKVILLYKWRQVMVPLTVQSLIYVLLVLILLIQTLIRDSPTTLVLILFLNTLFLFYEIAQLKMRLRSYFSSFWNLFDIVRISLLYTYPIIVFSNVQTVTQDWVLAASNIICWIRLVGFIRIFDPTRYLIRICTEVVKALGPFILVFFSIIFAICLAYYADSNSVYPYAQSIVNIYSLAYGQFNNGSDTDLQTFVFVVATLLLPLIMLNLIIALMGDIFAKVTSAMDVADKKEMASIILEIDSIMWVNWKKKKSTRKYIQQCNFAESKRNKNEWERETEEIMHIATNVEGKYKANEKKIENISNAFEKIANPDKGGYSNKVMELLMEIKSDIKDTKKELRMEMMKTKLDIAEIRKEVVRLKVN